MNMRKRQNNSCAMMKNSTAGCSGAVMKSTASFHGTDDKNKKRLA